MFGDRLRKEDWEVSSVALYDAQRMVEDYHYSKGGSNTCVYTHGLYRKEDGTLCGVAWWLPPTKAAGLATFPENGQGVLSLTRLVIIPSVPSNAASFLLARSRKLIDRHRWPCLVTYADTWRGHEGTIYKADNWVYAGLTKPTPIYVKDGRVVARKVGPRTRTHKELLAIGCEYLGKFPKHKYIHTPPKRYKSQPTTKNLFEEVFG